MFFAREATQTEQLPPPIERRKTKSVHVPLEPIALLGVGAFLGVRWRRRRRAAAAAQGKGQA